jgi:molybdate transport system substrate-binding protein
MNRTQPPTTRRETIHGGSTPASMRVMLVDRCPRFMSLTVNGAAVIKNEKLTNLFCRVCSSLFAVHFIFLCCVLLDSKKALADEVNIAVASNFKSTLQKISVDFKLASGHDLIISSASSGKLFAQIKHGAPYDVFLSADEKHPDLLIRNKAANSENAYVYALGKLVLISNIEINSDCKNVISSNRLKHLAIANPAIAPYGLAAKQVLQKLDLWRQLQPRIVMGENAAQTLQFIATKNAQAGFVARSMLNTAILNMGAQVDYACTWDVPSDMHSPIKQKMVVLNKVKGKPAVMSFIQYIQSSAVKEIIKSSGYDVL